MTLIRFWISKFLKIKYTVSIHIVQTQDVDENGAQRPEQLSVASGGQRHIQVLPADLREARIRGDLPLAQLHQAGRHPPGQHRHGQHNDAVRAYREAARQDPGLSCSGLHNGGQIRPVRVRARGSHIAGRQGPRRRLPVSFAASAQDTTAAVDQDTQRSAELSEREGGRRGQCDELVSQAVQGRGQGALLQEYESGDVFSLDDRGLLSGDLGRWDA